MTGQRIVVARSSRRDPGEARQQLAEAGYILRALGIPITDL
ncbi:hypothetical protein ACFPJ1_19895 [Kribbella qitaiheensis]